MILILLLLLLIGGYFSYVHITKTNSLVGGQITYIHSDKKADKYFKISEESLATIYDIFEKYGGTFPCI